MSIVVERPLLRRFLESRGRRLLYGRRKTGKTFYTRHVLRDYTYFIVRPGGAIYDPVEDEELSTGAFLRLCRTGDRIILDEFHRAERRLFDALQAGVCTEDLVFITSTLHYHRSLLEPPGAPLKGLFAERRVGLLSPVELLAHPWPEPSDWRSFIELLVLYQEPTLIGRSLVDIVAGGRELARSLVGEVLTEEDRAYTARYDAILEAIAAGHERAGEIASYLHARGLLEKPSTGSVMKYLIDMTRMGLLEALEVWGKKRRRVYRHASPLTDLVYYLDARYGFYDLPLPEIRAVKAAEQRLPLLVERFVERLLADARGLRPVRILDPEVDVALVEYRRLRLVAEVKWIRGKLGRRELNRIEAKLLSLPADERLLVVPDASQLAGETGLTILDARGLAEEARRAAESWGLV